MGTGTPHATPRADPVPGHRGVVRVDVELRDVAIDQCSSGPGWFSDTHRCDLNSTQVPSPGSSPLPPAGLPVPRVPPSGLSFILSAGRSICFAQLLSHRCEGFIVQIFPSLPPAAPCDPAAPFPGTAGTVGTGLAASPPLPKPLQWCPTRRDLSVSELGTTSSTPGQGKPRSPPASGSRLELSPRGEGVASSCFLPAMPSGGPGRAPGIAPENNNAQRGRQRGPFGAGGGRGGLGSRARPEAAVTAGQD